MGKFAHRFVHQYRGLLGFGFDRETDEKTLKVYLQMFSDDTFLESFVPRLSDQEMEDLIGQIFRLLKNHLKDDEYHSLFLKDDEDLEIRSDPEGDEEKNGQSGEDQLRWLCSKKGLDWDSLTEKEKEEFILEITRC